MKIVYIAFHNQTWNNDDEGAIAHAFRELGHEVACFGTKNISKAMKEKGDFVLFHHWRQGPMWLERFHLPKVLWFFDLIDAKDSVVAGRSMYRRSHVETMTRLASFGFCTDGDYVKEDTTGKLYHLPQGADGRIVGRGTKRVEAVPPIMFQGLSHRNGAERTRFVEKMHQVYDKDFLHLTGEYRLFLRDYIASTEIVVCPSAPVTDRYWSNRVYLSTGFGGCVLHPWSSGLREHFTPSEVLMYRNFEELQSLIMQLRGEQHRPRKIREEIAEAALTRVKKQHLYRHRVEEMIRVLKAKKIV